MHAIFRLSMNHSSLIYLVIHLRYITERISSILCYIIRTKYRYLWSRGEEETLCQPTFYAVWIRISRGYSSVYANSTYVASLFFEILPKIPRENGLRPIGNIENSTIVSAVFWILTTRSRRMEEGREQKGGKEVDKRKKYDKKGRDIRKVFESEYKIRSLAIFNLVFYRKSERCCFSSATHRWDYIITE